MTIEFYDVKVGKPVSIPENNVVRTTFSQGSAQTPRYGLKGKTADGRLLTKFIGKADWDALKVPTEK